MQMEFKFAQSFIKFLVNVDLIVRYKCDGPNFFVKYNSQGMQKGRNQIVRTSKVLPWDMAFKTLPHAFKEAKRSAANRHAVLCDCLMILLRHVVLSKEIMNETKSQT